MRAILFTILFGITASISAQIPTNGLVAYYPFTGNANDSSGNANHGLVNGATLTTDRFGNANSAYYFDGVTAYISAVNSTSLQSPTNQLTMSAWVNAEDLLNRNWVLDKRMNLSVAPYSSFTLFANNNSSSQAFGAQVNNISTFATTTTIANTWYHLVAVYTGSTISIYVNAALENSANVSGNISYTSLPLYIGTNMSDYMKGKIDDIRIYNKALTQQEITALYNEHTVGLKEIKTTLNIELYPNPTKDKININFNTINANEKHVLQILNGLGQVIYSTCINQQNSTLDVSSIGTGGIFMVNIIDGSNTIIDSRKIVLQ